MNKRKIGNSGLEVSEIILTNLEHISNKNCYFITAGAGDKKEYFKTIIDTYHGFINCFPNMKDGGIILGLGAQAKGSIKENKAMREAYELGKSIK